MFIRVELQFNIVRFKITCLRNHITQEMDLQTFIGMLELVYYNNFHLVGYSRLNVFEFYKMTPLEAIFQSQKVEAVARI